MKTKTHRTTIELPDPLYRRVKATAALRGITLKELATSALEHEIKRVPEKQDETPGWMKLYGKADDEMKEEIDRVQQIIDDEFSSVELENWS